MNPYGIEPLELKELEKADYLCNLCAFIDYTDDPPPGMFDDVPTGNPFSETILRKIGGTWYSIRTECDGTETLASKVKRLIFSDPISGKVVLQG